MDKLPKKKMNRKVIVYTCQASEEELITEAVPCDGYGIPNEDCVCKFLKREEVIYEYES